MVFPLRTPRLHRLLLSGALALATGVMVSGPSSPALAQTNPYCYAPYYNPYYCQYYSSYYGYNYPYYNYSYPYYSYGYGYPAYPYYGVGVTPFALGFGVGGGYYAHRNFTGRTDHRGFANRTFHGTAPHSVQRGIAGGSFHGRAGSFHPSSVQHFLAPMVNYAHHH